LFCFFEWPQKEGIVAVTPYDIAKNLVFSFQKYNLITFETRQLNCICFDMFILKRNQNPLFIRVLSLNPVLFPRRWAKKPNIRFTKIREKRKTTILNHQSQAKDHAQHWKSTVSPAVIDTKNKVTFISGLESLNKSEYCIWLIASNR